MKKEDKKTGDIGMTKQEDILDERLRFEELLSELSAKFVNLPAIEVNDQIEAGLRRIAEFLKIDRSVLYQFSGDGGELIETHSFSLPGLQPIPTEIRTSDKSTWFTKKVFEGEPFALENLPDSLPEEATFERETHLKFEAKSFLSIPVKAGGSIIGVINFISHAEERSWPDSLVKRLRLVGEIFSNALSRKRSEESLHNALAEIKQLKEILELENVYLQERIKKDGVYDDIVGRSADTISILHRLEQVAPTDATVLILGETGTGKGLIVRAIHRRSLRGHKPLVIVNCAAIPAYLMESELFGREKGAYTGAQSRQIGRFELANEGTIFLDEIGDMPFELQAKALRIIEEGEFERLGSSRTIKISCRIIAATNRNLVEEIRQGRFRADLFHRLNVFPITMLPLRQRQEEIPLLAHYFVRKFNEKYGKQIRAIPQSLLSSLQKHGWPGNVRELQNVIERAVITSNGSTLHLADKLGLSCTPTTPETRDRPLAEIEREYILSILEKSGWKIKGPKGAAEILGLNYGTLRSRIKKLGIQKRA